MTNTQHSEASEMIRYIELRAIYAKLRPADSPVNGRIVGAANRAAICMAGEVTQSEMMVDIAERVPGLSEEETAIAIKIAAQFVETKAAA